VKYTGRTDIPDRDEEAPCLRRGLLAFSGARQDARSERPPFCLIQGALLAGFIGINDSFFTFFRVNMLSDREPTEFTLHRCLACLASDSTGLFLSKY
ncbi:hypothetical protein NFB71_16390, partial [Yersinia ruckeri]|uniref:hypothetical protein n=1 Tax=Yersinia ruckeri TaxID=29486 RepID=UPI0022380856